MTETSSEAIISTIKTVKPVAAEELKTEDSQKPTPKSAALSNESEFDADKIMASWRQSPE